MIRKNKTRSALAMLVLAALLLVACGGNDPSHTGANIRTDELGLVTVEIKDGEATVTFDPERWAEYEEETHFYEEQPGAVEISAVPFPIAAESGKIVDAVICQIEAFDFDPLSDFVLPSILLMMEDGGVEWAIANPFFMTPGESIHTVMRLPFLENIVGLSCEAEREGMGLMTVYATDADGREYDVRRSYEFSQLLKGMWHCGYQYRSSEYEMHMMFGKNGVLKLNKSLLYSDDWGVAYTGTYTLHLDEGMSGGLRAGMLSVDLALASGQDLVYIMDEPETIAGSFFANGGGFEGWFSLYHSDGDPLHVAGGVPMESCTFWVDYASGAQDGEGTFLSSDFFDDEELIDYIVRNVPGARELTDLGMSALVTGEISFMRFEGDCRDVWFGTDHPDQFVKEVLYTVGPWGAIYRYNAITDEWEGVFEPYGAG
jgi:hypothetical protein